MGGGAAHLIGVGHQLAATVPLATRQHRAGAVGEGDGQGEVASGDGEGDEVEANGAAGVSFEGGLQLGGVVGSDGGAGNPQGDTVAEEDFRKTFANHGLDAPFLQGLGGMFTGGTAAKVTIDHQNIRPLVLGLIEGVSAVAGGAIVGEGMGPQPVKGNAAQVTGGNNAIGIDVAAAQGETAARNGFYFTHGSISTRVGVTFHDRRSRSPTQSPLIRRQGNKLRFPRNRIKVARHPIPFCLLDAIAPT